MIISDHAIKQYQARIYNTPNAREEIEDALGNVLGDYRKTSHERLALVRNAAGYVFGVAITGNTIVTVGPAWYWHELRPIYRQYMRSRRHWRAAKRDTMKQEAGR